MHGLKKAQTPCRETDSLARETGQGLTVELLSSSSPQTHMQKEAMEQERMPRLDSLAQDLPHLVKLLQHNLASQDSKLPRARGVEL